MRQAAEAQADEIRETLRCELETRPGPVLVAIDIGDNAVRRRKERKSATIALFEDDSMKVEGEDFAGEWRLQDIGNDASVDFDRLMSDFDDGSSEDDFLQSFDENVGLPRGVIAAAVVEAVPAAKIAPTASAVGKPYPCLLYTSPSPRD